ncbi:MAG: hypothetical protein FWG66_01040 [Spirochaetes bacterium]|nr:hypothetical protein [Spirochaetota bacterium]
MSGAIAVLVFFSGFSANLLLQCALGIKGVALNEEFRIHTTLVKLGIVFTAAMLLWIVFDFLLFFLPAPLTLYVLVFPVGALAFDGLDFLLYRVVLKKEIAKDSYVDFCGGITAAVLFICLNAANNIIGAFALSLGFASGILLSVMILREIRRRAALEAVPVFLRGNPLLLISMGLLSMVFYAASLMLFRISGG